MCLSHPRQYISLCITQNTSFFAISGYSCTPALNCMRSHGSLAYNCLQCACHRMGQFTGVQNLIEIRQCLRRWRCKIFTGHTFAIQGVRALSCACFQKECISVQCPGFGGLRLYVYFRIVVTELWSNGNPRDAFERGHVCSNRDLSPFLHMPHPATPGCLWASLLSASPPWLCLSPVISGYWSLNFGPTEILEPPNLRDDP